MSTRYEKASSYIIEKLEAGLSPMLYYHSISHVHDVLNAAKEIATSENMLESEIELIKIAALFHDSGFIVQQKEHEEISCDFARELLPHFGYNGDEIAVICGMIMATRYPHFPKNKFEEIICDADLDYLGRDDYYDIANLLYKELISQGSIANEIQWNVMQVKFLNSHQYFTHTSNQIRNEKKLLRIKELTELTNSYNH